MKKLLAALVFATVTAPCFSNDGYGELGLGGVVTLGKTNSVVMAKEILEVSPSLIRVDYVFENNGSHDKSKILVLFPLPLYGAEKPSWEWAGAPRAFTTTLNGQSKPFKSMVKARADTCPDFDKNRLCAKDVTKELKEAGLTEEQIALFPVATPFVTEKGKPVVVPKLTKVQQEQLLKLGLLNREGPSGEPLYPTWLADVTYLWEMDFNGQKSIEVSHQYVPFTSGGAESAYFDENTLRNDYCAEDGTINSLRKLIKSDLQPEQPTDVLRLDGSRVAYILTTANSWGGPIGEFTLRLKKSRASELVLLCFPGKVRKVDPLTLEINLKRFVPKNELRVLFINTSAEVSQGSRAGVPPVISK